MKPDRNLDPEWRRDTSARAVRSSFDSARACYRAPETLSVVPSIATIADAVDESNDLQPRLIPWRAASPIHQRDCPFVLFVGSTLPEQDFNTCLRRLIRPDLFRLSAK